MSKIRLDVLLTQRALAESRKKAQALILAGEITVDGRLVDKVATRIEEDAEIIVREKPPYVGRGGLKIEAALDAFQIDPSGRVAVDVGSSTGGFTDCMLQRGVARVYAIDCGYGQLVWSLRQDPRVVVMERTNARYVDALPEAVGLVSIDVSFISLRLILPQVQRWLAPDGDVVALIKTKFEAGRDLVGKGGVIRDRRVHRLVLEQMLQWAQQQGWHLDGLIVSPIHGAKGNIEFLAHWTGRQPNMSNDIAPMIECALEQAYAQR